MEIHFWGWSFAHRLYNKLTQTLGRVSNKLWIRTISRLHCMHYNRYTCRTFLGLRVCVTEMSQISVDARAVNLHDRRKRFFFVYKWWYYLLKNMLSNWNKRSLFYTSLYTSVHGSTHTYKLKLQPYPKLISNPTSSRLPFSTVLGKQTSVAQRTVH